jgi:hypothetical protein
MVTLLDTRSSPTASKSGFFSGLANATIFRKALLDPGSALKAAGNKRAMRPGAGKVLSVVDVAGVSNEARVVTAGLFSEVFEDDAFFAVSCNGGEVERVRPRKNVD